MLIVQYYKFIPYQGFGFFSPPLFLASGPFDSTYSKKLPVSLNCFQQSVCYSAEHCSVFSLSASL